VQIIPLLGDLSVLKPSSSLPPSSVDFVFVSSRAAHWMGTETAQALLKPGGLLAVESSKFLVPLSKKERDAFNGKLEDFGAQQNWRRLSPGMCYLI